MLLSSGLEEEAFDRHGLKATRHSTHPATFREILRKYPHKDPRALLESLIDDGEDEPGSWFAVAKDFGFLDLALELAETERCLAGTLARAARDLGPRHPVFGLRVGLAALRAFADGVIHGRPLKHDEIMTAWRACEDADALLRASGIPSPDLRETVRERLRARPYGPFVLSVTGIDRPVAPATRPAR